MTSPTNPTREATRTGCSIREAQPSATPLSEERFRLSLDLDSETAWVLMTLCDGPRRRTKTEVIKKALRALRFLETYGNQITPDTKQAMQALINL